MIDSIAKIEEYFMEKDFYVQDYGTATFANKELVTLYVNGDWKHDHLYCDLLMSELGFEYLGCEVLEDTGRDWYPAKRLYCHKADAEFFNAVRKLFA